MQLCTALLSDARVVLADEAATEALLTFEYLRRQE